MPSNPNDTYVGPVIENDGGRSSSTHGGVYVAIGLAVLAIAIAFGGIWIGNSADNKAVAVDNRVTKLKAESDAAWKVQVKWNKETEADLAYAATRTDLLEAAVDKLKTKAEQKLVDQLVEEMKGKASNDRVTELASELMNKADKDAVKRIVRQVRKMDKRVDNIVNLNKLIEVAPVAPADETRKATMPVGEQMKAEQARIDAEKKAIPAVTPPPAPAVVLPGKAVAPGALYNPASPMQMGPGSVRQPPAK